MELISLLGAIVLAVAAFAFVMAPLWRRAGRPAEQPAEAPELTELVHERDVTLKTLRDLDFDYQLGKLSEEDYQALRAQYAVQGVAILQELDASLGVGSADLEEEIELEVQRRRGTSEHPVLEPALVGDGEDALADEIEAEVRKRRAARLAPAPVSTPKVDRGEQRRERPARVSADRPRTGPAGQCARCGLPYQPGDKFCARCGAALARICPACGAVVTSDARFCPQCGEKLGT
jgi:hypothetical protein